MSTWSERSDTVERFLIDDQGRTKKPLKPLYISPTIRREMHGNEPRVVEPSGWKEHEKSQTKVGEVMTFKPELPIRFTEDGFHQYRNDYKKSSVQGTHVTFQRGKSHALTSAHVPMVLEILGGNKTKVGDKVTNTHETKPFKYVSLFAGIGGFDTALNNLGGTCVMASEIDKYASQAYGALYGDVPEGDVTKIDAEDVPDHDLLAAGFPCQSFSVAGKRLGFEDTRGTLFFEVARIAKVKQPRVLLLENVKGLVGHDKGRTLDTIVRTLNEIGYRVDFEVLNSKFFGVPQNRERIFIVGIREDLVENEPWVNTKGTTIVPKGKRRIGAYEGIKTFNFDWPVQGEVTTKLRDILEPTVDEKYYLSDEKTAALVAKLDESAITDTDEVNVVGRVDWTKNDRTNRVYGIGGVSPTPSGLGQGGGTEPRVALPAEPPFCIHNIYGGFDESKPRVFKDESPTIRTSAGGGHLPSVVLNGLPVKEATKKGYAVAQEGDVVNYKFPDSKTRRGRVGKQIAHTLEATSINQGVVEREGCVNNRGTVETRETSNALDANYSKGIDNHGQRTQVLEGPRYRIRKLTPLECFRLQGFSDEAHQALVDAGISDTQRYKQAGNAVTVNVVEAIGAQLLPFI